MVPSLIARHASAVLLSCIVLALASLASLPLKAPEAFGSLTVSVRVEGESSTLRPLRSVTPEAPEPVSGCPVNSATTAINLAVEGTWDHGGAKGSKGDFTETILGETHNFTHESDTWAVWIDDKWAGGICEDLLAEGDEVLLVADHEPPPAYAGERGGGNTVHGSDQARAHPRRELPRNRGRHGHASRGRDRFGRRGQRDER